MKLLTTLALTLSLPIGAFAAVTLAPGSPAPLVASTATEAATFDVDNGHSCVVFRIKHFGVTNFYGRFNKVGGKVMWDAAAPEKSSISIEIDAASVDTGDTKRDDHVRNPDFFSAKEFPTIKFVSKSVKVVGKQLEVTGDLTLRGVTKSVTAKVDLTGEGETRFGYRAGFEANFEIKRSEFGVSAYPDALSDDVRLTVSLETVKA